MKKKLSNIAFWTAWLATVITLQIVLDLSWGERFLVVFGYLIVGGIWECIMNSTEIDDKYHDI